MKVDLKQFKKISKTNTHSVYSHPDGHFVKISHKSKGGLIDKETDPDTSTPVVGGAHYDEGGTVGNVPKDEAKKFEQSLNQALGQPQPSPSPRPNYDEGGEVSQDAPSLSPPSSAMQQSPQQQQPSIDLTQNPHGDIPSYSNLAQKQFKTLGQQGQAQAGIEQALGRTAGLGYQDLQNTSDELRENANAYSEDFAKAKQEFLDQKINPRQYIENMKTGNKIFTGIGLLLGGIGSGMIGQPNAALQVLQKNIDQDIAAQESELGKKHNMLSALHQKFQDINGAKEMQANLHKLAISQLAIQQAAASRSQYAKLAAQSLQNQYGMDVTQSLNKLDYARQLMQPSNVQPDPTISLANTARGMAMMGAMDPEHAKHVDKDISNVVSKMEAHRNIDKIFDELKQQKPWLNRAFSPLKSSQLIDQLNSRLVPLIQENEASRRLSPDVYKKEIAPFTMNAWTTDEGLEHARASVHALRETHAANETPVLNYYQNLKSMIPRYVPRKQFTHKMK